MDYNSVGRLLSLAPVTWQDGWPWFGLPGNLGRNPRTWVKPKTAKAQAIKVPYRRSDDFSARALQPLWQWNHVPVDAKWSLSERPGFLRLHALPATSLWDARNSLTQRAIGPASTPTVALDAAGMQDGDVAGLALLNLPFASLGVEKTADGLAVALFDQARGTTARAPVSSPRLWLHAECDFLREKARFAYSENGKDFRPIGEEFTMVFQLTTFQGVRYALFNYNTRQHEGGVADFDSIDVAQPHPRGLMRPIPVGKTVALSPHGSQKALGRFAVQDMGLGRVALRSGKDYLTVGADANVARQAGKPGTAQSFQWIETPTGELVLMSLATKRYLRLDPASQALMADSPGPQPDGADGVRFDWAF
jgi:hypothetical protein